MSTASTGVSHEAIEKVVREEWGLVLASLIRVTRDFALAEDVLQEAIASALERWPNDGVPANPAAWISTAARRKAIDRLRHLATVANKTREITALKELRAAERASEPAANPDDRLRLLFTCCHPALTTEAQVALTLRTLCGMTSDAIARAFLVPRVTMQQRLVRAKKKIRDAGIPYRVPTDEQLPERVAAVLATIYLVFNEGYASSAGDALVRRDLSSEAIWMGRVLVTLMPDDAEVAGLLALMLLHDSRREARVDAHGAIITLDLQDRTRWNRQLIDEGRTLLRDALARRRPGPYQIQAAIAAVHADATTADQTDWWQVVGLYDALLRHLPDSPVVELNRCAALAMADSPAAGLARMDDAHLSQRLAEYHPYHAARAELLRRAGRVDEALVAYEAALAFDLNEQERSFLAQRRRALDGVAAT